MTAMLASSLLYHLCWGCSFQNIFKCFLDRHSHPGSEFWSLRDRNLRQHEEKLTDMVPVTSPDSDHPAPNQQRGFQSVSSKLKFTLLRKRNYALSESHSNLGATPSDATGAYSPRMKDEMVLGSCLADTLIRFMKWGTFSWRQWVLSRGVTWAQLGFGKIVLITAMQSAVTLPHAVIPDTPSTRSPWLSPRYVKQNLG